MSFYSAEVITFTTDLNLNPVSSLFAVNLGGLLLQALLEFWPRTRINPMDEEENEVNHGERIVFCYIQQSEDFLCVCGGQPVSSLACVCVCVFTVNGEQENRVQKGNGYFQVPPHTPVIFGEAGGRTLFRFEQT